jgi:hypothetical protein
MILAFVVVDIRQVLLVGNLVVVGKYEHHILVFLVYKLVVEEQAGMFGLVLVAVVGMFECFHHNLVFQVGN